MNAPRDMLLDYLTIRRRLGYKLDRAQHLLSQFLDFLDGRGEQLVTIDNAVAWATLPADATANWWAFRLSQVRGFARYLHAHDLAHQVPPADLLPRRSRRSTPYLYSDDEIAALMRATRSLRLPLQQATHGTLIGLLAVTGMRVGEALRLDRADVDLRHGVITVRHSKYGKSRLLPLHPSTVRALRAYVRVRDRHHRTPVTFLDENEIDALLTAPDRTTWTGRRDHTLLVLAIQTGLRADELTALDIAAAHLATGAHVSCTGKGRKQRITPLTATTVAVLRVWLAERAGQPDDPLFPTIRGGRLSHDALERRLAKYTGIAAQHQPTLGAKNVTMHTLRHTAAMQLLHAGVDITVIALWLGHERTDTTRIYLHADLALKERALSRTKHADVKPGRYRPTDALLAFLEAL